MSSAAKILAVIPARGGSKGVPGKNIRLLAGKPLIAYSIEAARNARCVDRVIVSTDDSRIREVAHEYGAEVPFVRPAELATDSAPMIPVLIHALRWFESVAGPCDAVVLLQPTSPFRSATLIEDAIQKLRRDGSDMVVGLCEVPQHPNWMRTIEDGWVKPFLPVAAPATRRQDLPPTFAVSGSVYVWTRAALLRREQAGGATEFPDERVSPIIVEGAHALDIDSEFDFQLAELVAGECAAVAFA
jgi:CMP-N,N'-diacetyllegionaminic acid synthase